MSPPAALISTVLLGLERRKLLNVTGSRMIRHSSGKRIRSLSC